MSKALCNISSKYAALWVMNHEKSLNFTYISSSGILFVSIFYLVFEEETILCILPIFKSGWCCSCQWSFVNREFT